MQYLKPRPHNSRTTARDDPLPRIQNTIPMRFLLCSLALALAAAPIAAQPATSGPAGNATLSLDEALNLARRNNPSYLQDVEGRESAAAALRSAYGNLMPSINSSFSSSYRQGKTQLFNGVSLGATSDVISSSYGVDASMSLSRSGLLAPSAQRANLQATDAQIAASAQTLRTNVTQQYLAVLQQRARAELQDTLVATAEAQLELARVRAQVGSGTELDAQRAEVQLGQARVDALQARNQAEVELLRLYQQLGLPPQSSTTLTTTFPVERPSISLDQAMTMAQEQNPTLLALGARERVAAVGVKQARGEYFPTLRLSTGIGGYTSQYMDDAVLINQARQGARSGCLQREQILEIVGQPNDPSACNSIDLTPQQIESIREGNRTFPFDFTSNPITLNASLSLPIFNGFNREQRVQEAEVQRNQARYNARAQELKLEADVTGAFLTLETAYQTTQLQEQNARTAREALRLAQERYRVGASTLVELSQARDDFARAEQARINAQYEFHRAFATLENAVGRPLR